MSSVEKEQAPYCIERKISHLRQDGENRAAEVERPEQGGTECDCGEGEKDAGEGREFVERH